MRSLTLDQIELMIFAPFMENFPNASKNCKSEEKIKVPQTCCSDGTVEVLQERNNPREFFECRRKNPRARRDELLSTPCRQIRPYIEEIARLAR